jgi:hypothetical protein
MRFYELLPESDARDPIKPLPPSKKNRPDAYQSPQRKRTRYQNGTDSRWQTPPVERRAREEQVKTDSVKGIAPHNTL